MSGKLCEICNGLQKASDEEDHPLRGAFTASVICDSADGGCEGCQIIKKLCSTAFRRFQYDPYCSIKIYLGTRIWIEVLWMDSIHKTIHPFVQQCSPWSCLPVYSVSKPSPPALDSSCLRIRDWLGECRTTHEHCKDTEIALLPTRVIDVGTACVEPRLYVSGENERASYFALSHCWGPPDPNIRKLVTTRSNLKQHCVEIPLDSLPKTFYDAVKVTRSLGIRFLWIDSLCVIQGDKDDWEKEASKMADVYSHATLVIAADWSPNSSGGLFKHDIPSLDTLERHLWTTYQVDASGDSHAISFVNNKDNVHHATGVVMPCLEKSNKRVLHKRGWCMQERALARRIVYFCDVELLWECRELDKVLCSCGGPASTDLYIRDYAESPSACRPEPALGGLKWMGTVLTYTHRALSYDSDRLPAIGGLGRRLITPDSTYIAGIWLSDDTPYQLAWCSFDGVTGKACKGTIKRLPRDYAPSWSWASVAAPIGFEFYDRRDWDIIGSSFNLATEDPFGPVSHATLTLRCYVVPVLSLSADSISTSPDAMFMNDGRVAWDAGSLAGEWRGEEFEFLVLVAYFSDEHACGIVVRKRSVSEGIAGKATEERWQRIGFVWDDPSKRASMDKKTYDAAIETWISKNPKRDVVLE